MYYELATFTTMRNTFLMIYTSVTLIDIRYRKPFDLVSVMNG